MGAHEFAQAVERKLSLLAATEQAQYTDEVRKTSTTYIKVASGNLQRSLLEEYVSTSLRLHNRIYSELWAVETSGNINFLGAPAKDLLLRQHFGNSTTKIRKIFTVRKTKDAINVLALSFLAPPADYDHVKLAFDEAFERFSFSEHS